MKLFKRWGATALLVGIAVSLAYATVTYVQSFKVGGSYVWILENTGATMQTGAQKFGSSVTGTAVTLPTTTTGANFGQWVPIKNIGATALTTGDIICSSNTGTAYGLVCPAASDAKTVVGVAAEAIASGAVGWMTPLGGGYTVAHTTGTVAIGDILVSTAASAGYLAANNSPTAGTTVGKAMSAGTAAGGSTLVIMY